MTTSPTTKDVKTNVRTYKRARRVQGSLSRAPRGKDNRGDRWRAAQGQLRLGEAEKTGGRIPTLEAEIRRLEKALAASQTKHEAAAGREGAAEQKVAKLESELREVRQQGDRLAKILHNAADGPCPVSPAAVSPGRATRLCCSACRDRQQPCLGSFCWSKRFIPYTVIGRARQPPPPADPIRLRPFGASRRFPGVGRLWAGSSAHGCPPEPTSARRKPASDHA